MFILILLKSHKTFMQNIMKNQNKHILKRENTHTHTHTPHTNINKNIKTKQKKQKQERTN